MGVLESRECECTIAAFPQEKLLREKEAWRIDHVLRWDPVLRRNMQAQFPNFADNLYLCYVHEQLAEGINLKRYFIYDGDSAIGFDESGAYIEKGKQLNFCKEATFTNSNAVQTRMGQMLGTLPETFSFCLRNSEHVARYVQCSSWVSMQTLPSGAIGRHLLRYMDDDMKSRLNHPPDGIVSEPVTRHVYDTQKYSGLVEFQEKRKLLTRNDRDAYNVVFIGPTGAGKSKLINILFNCSVCKAAATAKSVTRHMEICSGKMKSTGKAVNVIDTIGLCDAEIFEQDVIELITEYIQRNCTHSYIDRVVVVCANRIENTHVRCIQKILKWLRFSEADNSDLFMFLYNKCDSRPEHERPANLAEMCSLLGIEQREVECLGDLLPSTFLRSNVGLPSTRSDEGMIALPSVRATGFSDIWSKTVADDVYAFLDYVFYPQHKPTYMWQGSPQRPHRLKVPTNDCQLL